MLVGATTVAPYGGEVMGLLATAVHAEMPVDRLLTDALRLPDVLTGRCSGPGRPGPLSLGPSGRLRPVTRPGRRVPAEGQDRGLMYSAARRDLPNLPP